MPIYEYACEKCGDEFEVEQRITDDPLAKHEGCGGSVKRLISMTTFTLRGSGWYSDLYGLKGSKENGSSKDKAGAGKTEPASKKQDKAETADKAPAATKTEKKAGATDSGGKAA